MKKSILVILGLLVSSVPDAFGVSCYRCSRETQCEGKTYKEALNEIEQETYATELQLRRFSHYHNYNRDYFDIEYDYQNYVAYDGLNFQNYQYSPTSHRISKRQEITIPPPPMQNVTTTPSSILPAIVPSTMQILNDPVRDAVATTAIVIGTAFISLLTITDTLPTYSLPNEAGGGVSPQNIRTPIQREALELTPSNRKPLSIFPPFPSQRTFPAAAVIYRQRPGLDNEIENSASFPSLQWFRENLSVFRRRAPSLFSCIDLDTELVGYRVRYNYTCYGESSTDCQILLPDSDVVNEIIDVGERRQTGESFCSQSSPECRVTSVSSLEECRNDFK